MRYLLLICGDENRLNNLPETEQTQRHEAWGAYTNELVTADKLRGGERLRPEAARAQHTLHNGARGGHGHPHNYSRRMGALGPDSHRRDDSTS